MPYSAAAALLEEQHIGLRGKHVANCLGSGSQDTSFVKVN